MCGIAGLIDPSSSEADARAHLQRMLDLIAHRGPDGAGLHTAPGLAIGMRRLSIIDLEGGWQPIWNEDQTIGVVFNGEIYNYLELRRDLIAAGHAFRTQTDTEVLVHLYEQDGDAMFAKLRGMFGFAIFDTRKKRLLLARDHFGQKPLYYAHDGARFAFASELKCLLALPWVSRERDPDAFLDYISWLSLPAPRTHLRGVWKLPPATFATISLDAPHQVNAQRYWTYALREPGDLDTLDAAVEQLDAVLEDSVKVHLRADVPVGVLLSSGLDSRCIAAYAQPFHPQGLTTFSVGFGDESSELAGAAETAREIGSRHFALELSAADFAESLPRIAWHLDEPVGDPAAFAVLRICELARQHVKVLLSGEGADELFAGYELRYAGMLQTMQRSDGFRRFTPFLPSPANDLAPGRWQRLLSRAHLSRGAEALALRQEGFPGDVRQPRGLTRAQLARLRIRQEDLASAHYTAQHDRLGELLALDLGWQLAESLLQKADKMSMAASVELRTPFLDVEVAAVAARIPSALKLPPGGPGKLVLRRCLGRRIPEAANRPKKGFPLPLRRWFTGPMREPIEAAIFASDAACLEVLERPRLRAAWDDFLAGSWDAPEVFYALWLYEIWARQLPTHA